MIYEELKKRFSLRGLSFWSTRGGSTHPKRDWLILFIVFLVVLIGIILFSVYLFLEINRGELYTLSSASSQKLDTIDRTLLTETLTSFEEKARRFSKTIDNPPNIPIP